MIDFIAKSLSALLALMAFLSPLGAQAPSTSNSPYSDQKFTPPDNPAWYETPSLWVALTLVLVVLIILRIRKQEKYT